MGRLATLGFEYNTNTAGVEWTTTTGTPTIQTATVRSGTYAGQITSLTSGTPKGWLFQYATATTAGPRWFRFAFRYHTLPGTNCAIAGLNVSGAFSTFIDDIAIVLTTTGALQLFDASGTQIGSNSSALTVDTWYSIEMHFDYTGGASFQVMEARLNGVVFATISNNNQGVNNLSLLLGGNLGSETNTAGSWFFDDVAINDNSGSSQTAYPGDGHVIRLKPNAAGDVNTFATQIGGTAGSANNFTRTNEVTPDDATSYNGSGTANQEDLFNADDSGIASNSTVNVVEIWARFTNSAASTIATLKVEVEKTASSTISQGSAIIPNSTSWFMNSTSAARLPTLVTYKDPTGSVWTQTTLDSMQIGYKFTVADSVKSINVTSVSAIVDYVPGAAVATSLSELPMLGVG